MSNAFPNAIDRRGFLKSAAAGAVAVVGGNFIPAGGCKCVSADDERDPYGGFKMAIQSFSLRGYDVKTALAHTRKLGLKYWEAYPRHIPLNTLPKYIDEQKAMLAEAGITLLAYGVLPFDANETKARQAFDFAQAMGLVSISANPQKDKLTFDLLDKLVGEYDIPIAIHNHGPGALYDKADDVVTWVRGRHPKIGACVDTGHYLRSEEDPVEVIERLGKRVFGVHLKDVRTINNPQEVARIKEVEREKKRKSLKDANKLMTILGEGDLNIVGCLKALQKFDYQYSVSIEYEENPDNPLSDIEVCLNSVRKAVQQMQQG